jgi:hypothetical protein
MDDQKQQKKGSGKKDDQKDPIIDAVAVPAKKKKPKTEAQIARERARRKRRRQKKKDLAKIGKDVPLFISSDEGTASDVSPPPDAVPKETGIPPTFGEDKDFVPAVSEDMDEIVDEEGANVVPKSPEVMSPSEMEESQRVFEENPVYSDSKISDADDSESEDFSEKKLEDKGPGSVMPEESMDAIPEESTDIPEEPKPEPVIVEEPSFVEQPLEASALSTDDMEEITPSVVEGDVVEESFSEEKMANEEALEKARELKETLAADDLMELEEIPQKQGILGKIFDAFTGVSKNREEISPRTTVSSDMDDLSTGAELEKPKGSGVLGKIVKFVFKLAVLGVLVIGAFWLGSSLKLMDYFGGLFSSTPGLELRVGDNQNVVLDTQMFRAWGFQTAKVLGQNQGDTTDLVYNVFFNANYFGKLKDPVFYGETGVTAALFFGFGRDDEFFQNKFIFYVDYLEKLNFANKVDISDVLDGQLRRDIALDDFIDETTGLFERGNELRKEINVQVDDLKISTNSLQPDKDRYETDFFASLQQLEGEKADILINKFIDTTQKQVELKAKLAAMTKLSEYYETVLVDMKMRLLAIEKNREALISGVTVTETPGVDLDLIRE